MTVTTGSERSSYSALTQHRKCPQAWNYGYRQHLTRATIQPAVEREFGTWWHAIRAAWLIDRERVLGRNMMFVPQELKGGDDSRVPTDGDVLTNAFSAVTSWWATLDADTQDEWVGKLGEPPADRLGTLLKNYETQWADALKYERCLALEMRWERPLPPLPDGTDSGVVLVGYVDEVYLDTKRNLLVIRDAKTSKALGTQSSADDLMDSQLQLYAWGAAPAIKAWGLGDVRAVAYDRIRTVKPKEPQVTQMGGLSKSVTDYDLATYRAWAAGPDGQGVPFPGRKKDGSGAGFYHAEDAVIERLSTPAARSVWFQRTLTPLSANVVRTHLRAAVDTALDVSATRERIDRNGDAARNLSSACRFCDYVALCRAQMIGGVEGEYPLEDYGLAVRERR